MNKINEKEQQEKLITSNRKARHEYTILETVESGIVLKGTEVKSVRNRNVNLQDSYATIQNGQVTLHNMHINPYEHANIFNVDPKRDRKLLLHKKQIRKLFSKTQEKGLTLVPLRAYFLGKNLKIELGLGKGKRSFDKREDIAKRDIERKMRRHEF